MKKRPNISNLLVFFLLFVAKFLTGYLKEYIVKGRKLRVNPVVIDVVFRQVFDDMCDVVTSTVTFDGELVSCILNVIHMVNLSDCFKVLCRKLSDVYDYIFRILDPALKLFASSM